MSKAQPNTVTIVGAGPGGLTLARILQLKGLKVKIYERESSADARFQGGTLDLHAESGQYALQMAGLFDKFKEISRPEGQNMHILDKNGTVYFEQVFDENYFHRPEIDQYDLQQLLLESLEPDTLAQGYNLQSIMPLGNGQHQLVFDNGFTETTDLVVGADGVW
jgi:2-polyprenyl-6-methoxyphenol hydroxylase-like FAD-dependent oxidoreductase